MVFVAYSIFFYKATQRFTKFTRYPEGIALYREAPAGRQVLEVRAQAAVAPSRYRDELALIDVRIALCCALRQRLDEGEVFAAVACEHACVVLSHFCPAVACQDGF